MQPLEVAFVSSLMSDKVSGVQAKKIARESSGAVHSPESLCNLDAVASRLRTIEVKQLSGMPRGAGAPWNFVSGSHRKRFGQHGGAGQSLRLQAQFGCVSRAAQ